MAVGIRNGLASYGDDGFSRLLRRAFIKVMGCSDDALSRFGSSRNQAIPAVPVGTGRQPGPLTPLRHPAHTPLQRDGRQVP